MRKLSSLSSPAGPVAPANRAWLFLLLASALEVVWAASLKYRTISLLIVIAALAGTFVLLIKAAQVLPVGTAYAVFTALGTAGTFVVETVVDGAGFDPTKFALIGLLLAFIVGLKLTSDGEPAARGERA